jgi:FkbM family methyltransferase
MQRFMKSGDVAYDIGANAGYFTLVMSKIAQTTGKVFSFEPDPKNFRALQTNIRNNGLKNAVAFQKAVSDTTGTVAFATFEYSLVGHIVTANTPEDAKLIEVKSISLDDFVYTEQFPSPSLIKIDVEGAEDRVILGADRLLREAKPVILAEVREGPIYQRIVKFLRDHDYRSEFLKGGWQQEKHHLADMLFIPNAHS